MKLFGFLGLERRFARAYLARAKLGATHKLNVPAGGISFGGAKPAVKYSPSKKTLAAQQRLSKRRRLLTFLVSLPPKFFHTAKTV